MRHDTCSLGKFIPSLSYYYADLLFLGSETSVVLSNFPTSSPTRGMGSSKTLSVPVGTGCLNTSCVCGRLRLQYLEVGLQILFKPWLDKIGGESIRVAVGFAVPLVFVTCLVYHNPDSDLVCKGDAGHRFKELWRSLQSNYHVNALGRAKALVNFNFQFLGIQTNPDDVPILDRVSDQLVRSDRDSCSHDLVQ
jgi:hypothetical protein